MNAKDKEKARKLSPAEQKRLARFEAEAEKLTKQGYKRRELTVGIVWANVFAFILGIPVLAVSLFLAFRNGTGTTYAVSFPLDPEKYPVTEEWTAQLEDPENGTVTITTGNGVISTSCHVEVIDVDKPADIILTDPEGNTYRIPAEVVDYGSGKSLIY